MPVLNRVSLFSEHHSERKCYLYHLPILGRLCVHLGLIGAEMVAGHRKYCAKSGFESIEK